MDKFDEIFLKGNPDAVTACITMAPYEGKYEILRTSGTPDFAKWDKTYYATYDVLLIHEDILTGQTNKPKIGKIQLQYIPGEKTRLRYLQPQNPDSPYGHFVREMLAELRKLGFTDIGNEKSLKEKEIKNNVQSPIQLFDALQFHQRVIQASRGLFKDGHYAEAIFEAFKAVENFVRDKAKCDLYGKSLMAKVFDENKPLIQVPEGGYFDKDVQEGFKFLFMGASQGIRNPKAHKDIKQNDPYITLEYLGFASFLLKRISYWEAGKE
jgi:uncharacterized protein (TIGR02391 family)